MINFIKTVVYIPLYNFLVLVLGVWPDAGVAVVILTVLIKIVLFPSTKKMAITQVRMKEKSGELTEIQEKYKDDKQLQATKVMEFYKKYDINPFSSFFMMFIQIPIIYSIYHIFLKSGLPSIDTGALYSFISAPGDVSMVFLGIVDIAQKSILLALIAGITSFIQMKLSPMTASANNKSGSKDDLASMMASQMKYTMPVIIFFISWRVSGVIALYLITMNVVGIIQDRIIKNKYLKNV